MDNKKEKIYSEFKQILHNQIINSLKKESDRAKLILIASWIDYFLRVKLQNEFSKGNKKARKDLFSANGPFATFSSKLNLAFCAGWVESDVYHDIQIIRKLRNDFAHSINDISLDEQGIRKEIEKFQVPKRQFYDWGDIWAISTGNGIIISSGEKPENVDKNLYIPGNFSLIVALPIIVIVLISNLQIAFQVDSYKDLIFTIGLPDYMQKIEK